MLTKFYQFTENELNGKSFEEGAIYITTDTNRIYSDYLGGGRSLISGEPIILSTEEDRENLLAPIPNRMYIIPEAGNMYIYTNEWIKLTKDIPIYESIGSVTGSELISLPESFNELIIEVKYWGTCGLFNIPRIALTSEEKYYLNGFYGADTSHGYFYIYVSLSYVGIFEVYFNGVEVTSECTVTVYKK